jgi:tyrosine-protein kinase Etk/Wzc
MAKQFHPIHQSMPISASDGVSPEEMESSVDFRALFSALRKGKRAIGMVTLGAVLLSLAIAFLLPVQYTATAAFIPPGSNSNLSGASALAGQLSQLSGLGGGLLGSAKSPGDLYVGILKSRSIAEDMVKRFRLQSVYNVRKESRAEKMLASRSSFLVGLKDSIVTVSVTDKSAERARDMANAYLEQLESKNGGLALTESSQRRLFFEQRLAREKNALADAEVNLKQSQERTRLIAPAGQTMVGIQATAELRSQIASRQVLLASLLQAGTEQNPGVLRLRSEIANLEGQVAQMENSKTGGPSGSFSSAQVPGLELEVVRRTRDVKYHETLFDIIARQYEAARLDEAHEAPLQILDRAIVPDTKSGPPRMYIVAGGLLLGLFGSAIVVLLWPRLAYLMHETA